MSGISDPPIVMSLLRESQIDLQKHLLRRPQSGNEIKDFELLTCAISWPEGFRQLIAHGISSNDLSQDGLSILDIALSSFATLGIVQYLLGLSMSFITPHTWVSANTFHLQRRGTESIEILHCVAAQLAECRQNSRLMLANELTYSAIETMYHRLYHAPNLSVVGAQALYDNGFTQVDYNEEKLDVPLLFHLEIPGPPERKLDLIQWFYDKKRSLSDSYRPSYINASQILVDTVIPDRSFSNELSEAMYESERILLLISNYRFILADAFSDPHQDHCTCFCSLGGCDVITIALKKSRNSHGRLERFILTEVFSLLRIKFEDHPELVQSALRIMTFDRLSMTHTCLWLHSERWSKQPSEHEKSEIHRTEKNDIAILETLLTHFDSEWSSYNGTFVEFLDSHWEPYMDKVLAERRAIPIDKEVLDDYGVKLIEYGPDEISEPRRPDDKYTIAWFQRVAEAIVDGREINEEDQWR